MVGMKPTLLIAACCAALLTACTSEVRFGFTPIRETNHVAEATSTNLVLVTNYVHVPEVRDTAGAVIEPAKEIQQIQPIYNVTTVPAHDQVQIVGWQKDEAKFQTGQTLLSMIPDAGPALAALFGAGGTLAAGIQTWIARRNAKKADANEKGLIGTIQGVEQIRSALQLTDKGKELDAKMLEALKKAQADYGAVEVVQKLIEQHTGYTTKQVNLAGLLDDKT